MLFAKKNFPLLGWWASAGLDAGFVPRASPARKNIGDVAPYCDCRDSDLSDLSDLIESRDPVALEGLWTSSAAEGGREGMCNWDIFADTVSALGFLAAGLGERVVTFGCSEGLEVLLMTRGRWATRGVGVVGGGRGLLLGAVLLEEDIVEGLRLNLGSVVTVEDMEEEEDELFVALDADAVVVEEVVVVAVVVVVVDDAVTVMTGSFIIVMA